MRRLFFFAPLALFVVVGMYFAEGLTRDPGYMPSMLIDRPAPTFDLPPIEGYAEGLSSDDFAGQVSLLNVFGSWCVSCNVEHPVLLAIKAEAVAPIYGLDWKDKPGAGTAWLARKGDPYAKVGDDADGRAAIDFGVTGAPETFVIDAAGRVRHKHVGPISREDWETVLRPMILDLKKQAGES
ncbi:MAG: DsbE family thiol:disulfide interchange protein [Alphaproteobacteria bacterium]|nr:DsbE family thiol:disulfide interchange protein [Alphaproteobacteria bacterium]